MERGFWGFWAGCLPLLAMVVWAAVFVFDAPSANARDLQGRFGMGYNSEFASSQGSAGAPGVSMKYGLTRDIAQSLVIGMRSGASNSSVIATKFFKNIFFETNMNFYFTAGIGLLSAYGSSGMELLGGLGSEFFIPGVESLGFSVETGASYNTLGGHSTLRTIGVSFLDAGIHFYF